MFITQEMCRHKIDATKTLIFRIVCELYLYFNIKLCTAELNQQQQQQIHYLLLQMFKYRILVNKSDY